MVIFHCCVSSPEGTGSFDALTCWHPIHFGLVWSCPFCQGAFCEDSGGFWAEIKHARTTEERQAGAMGRLGGEGPKVGTVGTWRLTANMIRSTGFCY